MSLKYRKAMRRQPEPWRGMHPKAGVRGGSHAKAAEKPKGPRSKKYDRPSSHPKDGRGCAINPQRRERAAEALEWQDKTGRRMTARQAKKARRRKALEAAPIAGLFHRN